MENVGLPGVLTPILDVGSELEDDDSIGKCVCVCACVCVCMRACVCVHAFV